MAHSAHFSPDVRHGALAADPSRQRCSDGGPGIVIGLGADDIPAEARGPGTSYLLDRVLWDLRNEDFEKQSWSGEKFRCLSCGKLMRYSSSATAADKGLRLIA